MKAEELTPKDLRIGNILTLYDETVTVQEIGNHHGSAYLTVEEKFGHGYHLDQFKPIPLSEELKIKLHTIENNGIAFDNKHIILFSAINQEMWFRLEDYPHLHQVQNLYYALVGEELEVSL